MEIYPRRLRSIQALVFFFLETKTTHMPVQPTLVMLS